MSILSQLEGYWKQIDASSIGFPDVVRRSTKSNYVRQSFKLLIGDEDFTCKENSVTDRPKAHWNVEYLHRADQLASTAD